MAPHKRALSAKTVTILEQIAEVRTYEQILARCLDYTYLDIFGAAREALRLGGKDCADYAARLAQIK